jgi:hypothetical protein
VAVVTVLALRPYIFCLGPEAWCRHELRGEIRLLMWAPGATRCNDMQGLVAMAWMHCKATLALYVRTLSYDDLAVLRGVLAGALFHAKLVAFLAFILCCPWNRMLRHCRGECLKWQHIHSKFYLPLACICAPWLPYTRNFLFLFFFLHLLAAAAAA